MGYPVPDSQPGESREDMPDLPDKNPEIWDFGRIKIGENGVFEKVPGGSEPIKGCDIL